MFSFASDLFVHYILAYEQTEERQEANRFVVSRSILSIEAYVLISVLNLDKSSFLNIPYNIFPVISLNILLEPPCLNALLNPLQVSRNPLMQALHCSAVRFAV